MTNHYTDVCEATIESLRQTVERQAAQIEQMREVLAYVKDACLYSDDDGAIGVTQEPHIDSLAFDMICKALTATPEQALEQFAERVREQCAKMCEAEYVNVADGDDEVYNSAITHASRGIRAIKELPK